MICLRDDFLIIDKLLWELIEPLNVRIEALRCCLQDMDPSLKYEIESISDPYGPTVRDASLQCLYVSDETVKGGLMINEERAKRVLVTDILLIDYAI